MNKPTPDYIRQALKEHAEACVIAGTTNNQIVVNATLNAMYKQIQAAVPDKEKLKVEDFARN